jgi:uroporphyrinogen-III synthase
MKTFSQPKIYAMFANPAHRKLTAELEKNGSKVFQFAPLETERIESETNSKIIVNAHNQFDWIIFPDVYAVEYFLEILEEQGIDLFELDAVHVIAYGEAVADKLRFAQLHADIIMNSEETNVVFSTLTNYIGEREIENLSFFLLKEIEFSFGLTEKLIKAGAKVTELPIYRILTNEKKEMTKLKTLLKGGAIDEFIFTSPEDIISIKHYVYPEILSEILSETKITGINEITTQTLNENNLSATKFKKAEGD